jgi:hypothetical protein
MEFKEVLVQAERSVRSERESSPSALTGFVRFLGGIWCDRGFAVLGGDVFDCNEFRLFQVTGAPPSTTCTGVSQQDGPVESTLRYVDVK